MSETSDQSAGGQPSAALRQALRRLLRPLVRLLLSQGVTLPALVQMLKRLYVESAEQDFPLAGRAVTDSRISLLTGVHRKDVRRLRQQPTESAAVARSLSLGIQLVSTWLADSRYLTGRGRPRVLPRRAQAAGAPSFEGLARQVCRQDIRPRAMLDELLRLGVVELDARDRVRLRREAFVPDAGLEEKAVYFGRNLGDHIAAAAHNLLGQGPSFPERSVHYSGLAPGDVGELKAQAERESGSLLRRLNHSARLLQRQRRGDAQATQRLNFGVYFYAEAAGGPGAEGGVGAAPPGDDGDGD